MSQVFISYHRAQRKLARLIAHRVAADGHAVWWDRGEKPGDSWSEAVSTALANSACVIVIWSKQAATSPWVLGEATAGYGRGTLISVLSDRTMPPSPFDSAPSADMQDWSGDSIDLAWIRLRDPLRAKMQQAEKTADVEAPLPPRRPPPIRVGFSSAAMTPPPAAYEEKRGSPLSAMLMLALGGLGLTGWYYRDQVGAELERLRAVGAEAPVEQQAYLPAPAPPIVQASSPAAPIAEPVPTPDAAPPEPAPTTVAAAAPVSSPVPVMTRTYEDWRDNFVPAPILRSLPRAQPETATTTPAALETTPAGALSSPPAPAAGAATRLERAMITQGHFVDLDGPGSRRLTDIWFAPDRNGYGLFLGVANSARMRLSTVRRATPANCAEGVLRRTPISARDLLRDGGLCIRSTDGAISAWRVEGIEKGEAGSVLRLRAVTS